MSFKLLQVIPRLDYGGAETGCYDIAHYLAEQNCGSYIATSGGDLLKFVDKKNNVTSFMKNLIFNPLVFSFLKFYGKQHSPHIYTIRKTVI